MTGPRQYLAKLKFLTVLGKVLVPLDHKLLRATGGRIGVGSALGLRTMLLTTTGRRSGRRREVVLQYIRWQGGFVVIGSNWGWRTASRLVGQPARPSRSDRGRGRPHRRGPRPAAVRRRTRAGLGGSRRPLARLRELRRDGRRPADQGLPACETNLMRRAENPATS